MNIGTLTPLSPEFPLEGVVWIHDILKSNTWIKHTFINYLKESCRLSFDEYFQFVKPNTINNYTSYTLLNLSQFPN